MSMRPKELASGEEPSTPASAGLLGLAAVLLVLSGLALLIDLQVAEVCRQRCIWGEVGKLVTLSEAFAHGMGVAMIVLVVAVLDPGRRRRIPRLLVLTFGAGLTCDLIKLLVPRRRPDHGDLPRTALDSFLGWAPIQGLEGSSRFLESGIQSFPSGHATVAVGLAIGLSWMYPRGRWVFGAIAVMAAFQRVASSAHYPSDVLGAAALACLVAAVCFAGGGLGAWFTRFEHKSHGA